MASAASSTPVKWVASDHDGLPMKRKQVAQACDTCRRRKKRCIHTENGDVTRPISRPNSTDPTHKASHPLPGNLFNSISRLIGSPPDSSHPANAVPNDGATSGSNEDEEEDATQVAANRLMELSSSRFISDLNPEGMFIQAAKPLPPNNTPYRDKNDLGVWLPPGASSSDGRNVDDDDDNTGGANGAASANGSDASKKAQSSQSGQTPHAKRRRSRNHPSGVAGGRGGTGRTALSEASMAYERARYAFAKECLKVYPPDDDFTVLHRIYCEKVHPILPVLKDSELERPRASASPPQATPTPPTPHAPHFSTTVFPTLIKQIISLSAATTDADAAASHLRLEPNGPLLTPRDFHRRLTDAVSVVLDADLIAHRFDYIRACILMSFFYQPSTEIDRNRPSFLCTQAAHHFQTIGAHLLGYRPERPDDDAERIFCALWALDRLAAILYARPCMMHAYDNGKNPEDCAVRQPPCFRLFMSVSIWLDKVLHLYRPRQPFVMIDIPVYEALILDAQAEKLPANLLATIEVLYHTACVLSCRQPLSAFSDVEDAPLNRDDRTYLPISIMNPRRSHSSDRIVWVTQTQPICLLPFVPYAVSIALSVQYKKMRYSRTPLFRTRARIGFKDIVALLKSMGDVFINARVNAALGECIWKQMEKAASTLAREELEGAHNGSAAATDDAASSKKTSMAPPPSRIAAAVDTLTNSTHTKELVPAAQANNAADAGAALVQAPGTIMLMPGPVPGTAIIPQAQAQTQAAAVTSSPLISTGPSQQSSMLTGTMSFLSGDFTNTNTNATSINAATMLPASTVAHTTAVTTALSNASVVATSAVSPSTMANVIGMQTTTTPLLDLSVLDSLDTDIDLFNNFDPNFDLGAIDTALEANLDMGMPQNWGPWNNLS
ncbi:fungal specific transcription factor [Ophiostoma piceae UAMH 11346]|uniref:Fungal specific transcription factor n=1 Tax=Ophiostoma piceae (strain UAMH 11346) TaxID=1262450 RepID=S3C8Q8_OPHP1|nr:fungal specific transcription factor [Ophiostoma piceae UAMH 11346]